MSRYGRCAAPIALCLCLLATQCARREEPDAKPIVAVSVQPQSYFVERIGGDLVRVEVMIPPGASPATHEPTIDQLEALSSATLYVKVGHPHFPFERVWLGRLLAEANGLVQIDTSEGLEYDDGDPHLWVAPSHARALAEAIHGALSRLLPQHRPLLDANLEILRAEIDAVDAEVRALLRGKRGASFVVFHPAWTYLADEYGLTQVAIEQHHKQPDPRQLALVIRRARKLGVDVIFAQPQFDPRSAEVVAAEVGAEVELIDPLAYEWPENLRHVASRIAEAARP